MAAKNPKLYGSIVKFNHRDYHSPWKSYQGIVVDGWTASQRAKATDKPSDSEYRKRRVLCVYCTESPRGKYVQMYATSATVIGAASQEALLTASESLIREAGLKHGQELTYEFRIVKKGNKAQNKGQA